MHILHLEASSGWGGQEIRILREAIGMRSRGHQIVFAVMRKAMLASKAREEGFQVYELNFKKPFWILGLFFLSWIVFYHRIHLINTHSSLDAWLGGIVARLTRRTVIRTRHLSTSIKQGWNSRMIYGFLADYVVTTCQTVVPLIAKQSGKPLTRLRSIATGVDPGKIQTNPEDVVRFRQSLGLRSDDILVGTACVMRSWKGIEDFLEAAHLLRSVQRIRWVVIGGGHVETYHARAKELHLDGIVHFTGHLETPYAAIEALDIFALLSTANEGVSQAVLQAAYLKRPLITTKTGGLQEVCLNEETGLIVSPFNPTEVVCAVEKLADSVDLREKMGKRAHALVMKQFTLQHTLDQMEEVYEIVQTG